MVLQEPIDPLSDRITQGKPVRIKGARKPAEVFVGDLNDADHDRATSHGVTTAD